MLHVLTFSAAIYRLFTTCIKQEFDGPTNNPIENIISPSKVKVCSFVFVIKKYICTHCQTVYFRDVM